ncbi:DUF3592 domain-containing protein [Streptomyces olivoreticuli]|nr:DUF3592 domain-containing protein [Streptomyces olivoreticuli]WKK23989.1 DUF3592 domain-containing protein [Streptomyces olivoreticuli]
MSVIGGVVFLIVGILIARVLIRIVAGRSRFRSGATMTTGTIVAYEVTYTDGSPIYHSIAEFRLQDGTVTRGRSVIASSPPAGRVGAAATVYYNPANPAEIDIDTNRTPVINCCAAAVAVVIVALALLCGLLLLIAGLFSP